MAFLGDTLALHEIGGFKLSLSHCFRICRTCMVTNEKASQYFNSKHFEPRCDSKHRKQCAELTGPLRDHYSTTYGITRQSILLNVCHFQMFGGSMPHDIMHDLFEGVVQYEIKLLLKFLLSKQLFTLEQFNRWWIHFDYGYSEVADKPTPMTQRNLDLNDKQLRQNASQCMLLCRILPLFVAQYVEDDSCWECYYTLLKIVQICISPMVNTDMCAIL